MRFKEIISEKWSQKYKSSINCANPKGFSQRAHCQGRKKNEQLVPEKLNRTDSRELVIFDIDDTLLHTTALINVVRDGKVIRTLTNQEFNNYKLGPGEEFDFGQFRDADKFEEESIPIGPMLDKLRADLAAGKNVVMLTARADFNNQKPVWRTFKRHGIDINRDVHLFRAGNLPGDNSPAVKKAIHVSEWLSTGKYKKVTMYDDSEKNLAVFKSLEKRFPDVEFEAHHVSEGGATKQVEESNSVSEYVYHASYLPDPNQGLLSIAKKGLTPSRTGQMGPGLYFAYDAEGGYYHVDPEDATMFRVKWSDLVKLYGVYPKNLKGIQRDNEQIVVPGPVPANMLEVEYFPDEWWDLQDAVNAIKYHSQNIDENGDDDDDFNQQDPGQPIPFPKGTTSVGVSDVYDWYKLGMIISDLDDANPAAFGRGAPSTVIAFGSEEEEHKFLPYLKRLGLKIQDIDRPEDTQKVVPAKFLMQRMQENFADGKKPGRKGLSKRMGVNTKASVSDLRKTAKNSTGEKQRMAHWLANMKAGRAKKK